VIDSDWAVTVVARVRKTGDPVAFAISALGVVTMAVVLQVTAWLVAGVWVRLRMIRCGVRPGWSWGAKVMGLKRAWVHPVIRNRASNRGSSLGSLWGIIVGVL
jgi:hypothetical protein